MDKKKTLTASPCQPIVEENGENQKQPSFSAPRAREKIEVSLKSFAIFAIRSESWPSLRTRRRPTRWIVTNRRLLCYVRSPDGSHFTTITTKIVRHADWHLAGRTFAGRDICRSRHLPIATFADWNSAGRDICRSRHLPVATFAGRHICRSRHLPVATFAGRDICRSELLITLSIEQDHAGSSG